MFLIVNKILFAFLSEPLTQVFLKILKPSFGYLVNGLWSSLVIPCFVEVDFIQIKMVCYSFIVLLKKLLALKCEGSIQ